MFGGQRNALQTTYKGICFFFSVQIFLAYTSFLTRTKQY